MCFVFFTETEFDNAKLLTKLLPADVALVLYSQEFSVE